MVGRTFVRAINTSSAAIKKQSITICSQNLFAKQATQQHTKANNLQRTDHLNHDSKPLRVFSCFS